jgi:thiol-disulfide isomerase/thioredoxin
MKTKQMAAIAAIAALAAALGIGAQHWMQKGPTDAGSNEAPSAAADGSNAPTAHAGAPTDPVAALWNAPLTDPSGKPATLAPFKGHITVVNFWASWCGPCVEEMPTLARLHHQYVSRGVQFVGVGVDSQKNVAAFLQKVPVDYPVFVSGFGGADLARNLGNGAGALPFTVVIDANGAVRSTKLGEVVPSELKATLDAMRSG